jgi:DNA-binding CsgD family transcriptional regulator
MSGASDYLRWDTPVQALGRTWTVRRLGKSKHCFVPWETFFWRMRSLGPDPDPYDVEAALCLKRDLWIYYREHGHLTDEQIELLDVTPDEPDPADPVASLMVFRMRRLTPRQREVLVELLEGRTTAEIAAATHLTEGTVGHYKYLIRRKLGVTSFTHDTVWKDPDVIEAVKDITNARKDYP